MREPDSAPPFPTLPIGSSAHERVHQLLEWLRSGKPLTTSVAAEAFGVSRRTIARDLACIRNSLTLDVQFDAAENSYVLATEHNALPFLAFPSLAPILFSGTTAPAQGDSHSEVQVRFSARSIQGYRSRGGTIPEEAIREDGTVEAYFPLKNPDEFLSYVLSRGHDIEVLAPPEFRTRVHMEIRRMLSIYECADPPSP